MKCLIVINHELVLSDNDFAQLLIVLNDRHYNRRCEYGAFALVITQAVLCFIMLATEADKRCGVGKIS